MFDELFCCLICYCSFATQGQHNKSTLKAFAKSCTIKCWRNRGQKQKKRLYHQSNSTHIVLLLIKWTERIEKSTEIFLGVVVQFRAIMKWISLNETMWAGTSYNSSIEWNWVLLNIKLDFPLKYGHETFQMSDAGAHINDLKNNNQNYRYSLKGCDTWLNNL